MCGAIPLITQYAFMAWCLVKNRKAKGNGRTGGGALQEIKLSRHGGKDRAVCL